MGKTTTVARSELAATASMISSIDPGNMAADPPASAVESASYDLRPSQIKSPRSSCLRALGLTAALRNSSIVGGESAASSSVDKNNKLKTTSEEFFANLVQFFCAHVIASTGRVVVEEQIITFK